MTLIQTNTKSHDPASFRDPSGFVFQHDGIIYRKINPMYMPQYKHLMSSGLYETLLKEKLMVKHDEAEQTNEGGVIIRPAQIPYISYPYEWCFEQYKDAAIVTLRIQLLALKFGMSLKDASAYNIQFINSRPKLIDTLSFDMYVETPWTAYGQFCRHFFAPLLLMAHVDQRLGKMMQTYIDGIPLDLADCILHGKGGFAAWQHVKLHAKAVNSYGEEGKKADKAVQLTMKKPILESIINSLIRTIEKLKIKKMITEWGDYYSATNYEGTAAKHKENIVKEYLANITGSFAESTQKNDNFLIWDLGANNGRYSRLALEYGINIVAFDIDPVAVGRNYLEERKKRTKMLPLLLDLTCPSPAIGFANSERQTIDGRRKPNAVLMLAVIHHLAISNNLPLEKIAQWLSSLCEYLIIEFVPKEDSQVKILLKTRMDIFPEYTTEGFEAAFNKYFSLCNKIQIEQSQRTLYLFKVINH